MGKQPVQAEVVFKLPGDSAETRVAFVGERSNVLSDPQKLQQLLEIMGLIVFDCPVQHGINGCSGGCCS